jgi:hypothetical protein
MLMYLQKEISKKHGILKAKDEKSRTRVRNRIRIQIRIYNLVYGSKDPDPDPSLNVTHLEHCFLRDPTISMCTKVNPQVLRRAS